MASREVVAELNLLVDRPWSELRPGRRITEHWLAHQLRPYGLQPRTLWIDEKTVRGYLLEEIVAASRRYARRQDLEEAVANATLRRASCEAAEDDGDEGEDGDAAADTGQLAAQLQDAILEKLRVKSPRVP